MRLGTEYDRTATQGRLAAATGEHSNEIRHFFDVHDVDAGGVTKIAIEMAHAAVHGDPAPTIATFAALFAGGVALGLHLADEAAAEATIMEMMEHTSWTPEEGDHGYHCDNDACPLAPHVAPSPDGAYTYRNGRWQS